MRRVLTYIHDIMTCMYPGQRVLMHVLVSTSTRPVSAHIPGADVAHLRPNLLVATRAELIAGSLSNDEIRAKARRRLRQECVAQSLGC